MINSVPEWPTEVGSRGRTSRIVHTVSGGGYDGVTVADIPVLVVDNEWPALRLTPESLTVAQGEEQSYSVQLAAAPPGTVTVELEVSDSVAVSVSRSRLIFTQRNWNDAQQVNVRVKDDDAPDERRVAIAHTVLGGGYERASVTVTVPGDDGGATPSPEPREETALTGLTLSPTSNRPAALDVSWQALDETPDVTMEAPGYLVQWNRAISPTAWTSAPPRYRPVSTGPSPTGSRTCSPTQPTQ